MTAQKISRNWKIYLIVAQTVGAGSSGWAGVGVAVVPIFIKLNWYKSWLEKNVDRLLLINWGQLHNGVAIYSGVLFSSVLLFLIFEFANSSSTDKINMHNCSCSNEKKEESTHLFLFYCYCHFNRIVTAGYISVRGWHLFTLVSVSGQSWRAAQFTGRRLSRNWARCGTLRCTLYTTSLYSVLFQI